MTQHFDYVESPNADDGFISFNCPHCQESAAYMKDTAGTIQICPHCGQNFVVPDADGQSAGIVPLPIKTARLSLRRLRSDDFEDLLALLSIEEMPLYIEQNLATEQQVENWLTNVLKSEFTVSRQLTLGIESDANQKLIGLIYLNDYGNTQRQMFLSIHLRPQYQNQRFGIEAVRAVLTFCFRDIGQHRVFASCDTRNLAAVRLMTRCGMRQESEGLKDHYINGGWADSFWFAVLEEEYGIRCRQ